MQHFLRAIGTIKMLNIPLHMCMATALTLVTRLVFLKNPKQVTAGPLTEVTYLERVSTPCCDSCDIDDFCFFLVY